MALCEDLSAGLFGPPSPGLGFSTGSHCVEINCVSRSPLPHFIKLVTIYLLSSS